MADDLRDFAWCPKCQGNGELVLCPRSCDGSHVADEPYRCLECGGTGRVSLDVTGMAEPTPSLVDAKGQEPT